MLGKLLKRLLGVPQLLVGVATLKADVQASLQDTEVKVAWERFINDPAVAAIAPRISSEWRAVEEAVNQLK